MLYPRGVFIMTFIEQLDQFRAQTRFTFQPLQIEIKLGSPVVMSYPWINFDGLIMYGMGALIFKEKWQSMASSGQLDLLFTQIPLPIKCTNHVYHASIGRFSSPTGQGSVDLFKPLSVEYLPYCNPTKARYMIVGGDFKIHQKRFATNYSSWLRFWVNGDLSWIDRILKDHLPGVGKRINIGYGKVVSTKIDTIPQDLSIIHPLYGLNRPLPIEEQGSFTLPHHPYIEGFVASSPPYWAKMNHGRCLLPEGII
jgi:hypothetical protein